MKVSQLHKFGAPEVLVYEDAPTPTPGPGEALVRIAACGVNRMDVELRAGVYGGESLLDFYFGQMIEFPHIPGIEPVGTVEAIGEGVTSVSVGDRVAPHSHLSCGHCVSCLAGKDNACPSIQVLGVQTPGVGGYAQYFCWPADLLIQLADSVDFVTAAGLLVNYGPVWTGLVERAELKPGETLLVTGASGGAGHGAIEIGLLMGARVLALAGSDEKMEEIRSLGAEPIDYRNGFLEAVMAATGGRGVDVVCELVGAATFAESVSAATVRGRMVVIGSHGGIRGSLNLGELFAKNLAIHGVTRLSHGASIKLVELMGQGKLTPKIWKALPMQEAPESHRLMEQREHSGKIVLTID
jgi:NADPH:quinone reductase-like Zn-dependent oxidoreductase